MPLLLVMAAADTRAEPRTTRGDGRRIVPGEVLVGLERTLLGPAGLARLHGLPLERTLRGRDDVAVLGVVPGTEEAVARALSRTVGVRWASPNHLVRAASAPDDPAYPLQWHLGTRDRAAGAANWQPVHGGATTGDGVVVGVVDTGINRGDDLPRVTTIDLVRPGGDAADPNGHGTHVAGTIAQRTGNGVGAAGVAPDAAIVAVRALDASGAGPSSRLIEGMAAAVRAGADVLNLSFAGDHDGGLCDAVTRAVERGVVVIAAAGNGAGPVAFPAACPDAIAVAATTILGAPATYTNRGPQVALAAPGGDLSTDLDLDGHPDGILQRGIVEGTSGNVLLAGTSMAAATVSGTAALLLQAAPTLSVEAVREALQATAVDLGPPGPDDDSGAGLLDIAAAVAAVTGTAPPPETGRPGATAQPDATAEPAPTPRTAPGAGPGARRIAGSSRFGTAVAVSREGWAGGAPRAFLTSGRAFPDALATAALSERLPGPVLLTEPCALPEEVAQELARLGPAEVIAIGGEQAVCTSVLLDAARHGLATARRIAGPDRYGTAAALAAEAYDTAATVYVASGLAFPDSLAGGAAAAEEQAPLLLTAPCSLPQSTSDELRRLRPRQIIVLGGTRAVCEAVELRLREATGATTIRLAGRTRYDTAAATIDRVFRSAPSVFAASGATFPDALAAGPLAAVRNAPILLVEQCDVPSATRNTISKLAPEAVAVLGGPAAVCDGQLGAIAGTQRLFFTDYDAVAPTPDADVVWQSEQEPAEDRITVVTGDAVPGGPTRPGSALRVELRPFDGGAGDVQGGRYSRAEVYDRHAVPGSTPPAQWPDPVGSTRWYGFDLYVPADFTEARDTTWFTLTQWKGWATGSPAIALEIQRGELQMAGAVARHGLGPLRKGEWERLVVGVHFQADPSGWVEVLRDGRQALPRTHQRTMNRNTDGSVDPSYLKQGIYRSTRWGDVTHVLHFGPMSIGTSRDDVAYS